MSELMNIFRKAGQKNCQDAMLECLFEARADTALHERIMYDKQYQKSSQEITERNEKIEEIDLNSEQWQAIDDLISAYNENRFEYGRVAYSQGFMDAVNLLVEILLCNESEILYYYQVPDYIK